jgi:hypothetical protein
LYRNSLKLLTEVHAQLLEKEEAVRSDESRLDPGWDPPADAYDAATMLSECVPIMGRGSEDSFVTLALAATLEKEALQPPATSQPSASVATSAGRVKLRVTVPRSGPGTFAFPVTGLMAADPSLVTATATSLATGDTSELSDPVSVTG